jgi:pimeloyl-ACP methyl ester carboxylesterase
LNLATLARELPAILGPLPIATGARFERPVRFIRGERSDRITAAAEPMIAGLFPDYRIDTIAGGGHWPHAEAPAAFLAAFARVLRD